MRAVGRYYEGHLQYRSMLHVKNTLAGRSDVHEEFPFMRINMVERSNYLEFYTQFVFILVKVFKYILQPIIFYLLITFKITVRFTHKC